MYPETPEGWTRLVERRVGPFPTSVTYRQPDGSPARWRSRTHRKRVSALSRAPRAGERERRWWWAPGRASWWIGVLFSVGSLCFLVAPLPGVAEAIGGGADAAAFFVGSIFFTSAAALQHLEAVNADPQLGQAASDPGRRRIRFLSIEPGRIDWWATLIQLVGTLLFNVDTFDAMLDGLGAGGQDRLVWTPDALGSICFLVASYLAFAEAAEAWHRWAPHDREWRIGAINLAGSVAFGISAIASYVVPATGDALDLAAANGFTALGALCFLGGALMLFPEGAEPAPPEPLGPLEPS